MNKKIQAKTSRNLLLLSGLSLLTSCADMGGQVAGIEGTGDRVTSVGTVSAYGSIYVNGVRFRTEGAVIGIDGDDTLTEESLALGMVVQVEGTVDNTGSGLATRITYDPNLRGIVEQVESASATSKRVTVLGQPVIVNADISFDGTSYESLAVGQWLTVSGYLSRTGELSATRVVEDADINTNAGFEVEGSVTEVSLENYDLTINGLRINFHIADFDNLSQDELKTGLLLEIKGQDLDANGSLIARQIKQKTSVPSVAATTKVEFEGLIGSFVSIGQFEVQGVSVDASQAEIRRGHASALAAGVKVVVKGRVNDQGQLVADVLILSLSSDLMMQGAVEAIDLVANRITVMGTDFAVDSLTAFEDRSPLTNRYLNLERISVGDTVQIFARSSGDTAYVTRIKRIPDTDGPDLLDGIVDDIGKEGEVRVSGVTVTASNEEVAKKMAGLRAGQGVQLQVIPSAQGQLSATELTPPSASPAGR